MVFLPIRLARLSDIGLEKRSHSVANEGMQSFIWGVFAEREDSELRRHGLVCVDDWSPFNESQAAGEQERGDSQTDPSPGSLHQIGSLGPDMVNGRAHG